MSRGDQFWVARIELSSQRRADSLAGILLAELRGQGFARIQVVDIKPFEEWYQRFDDVENLSLDMNQIA